MSQFLPLQGFARSLLTAQPLPQVPDWSTFRALPLSPFVSEFGWERQVREFGFPILVEIAERDDGGRQPRHAVDLTGAVLPIDVEYIGGRHAR